MQSPQPAQPRRRSSEIGALLTIDFVTHGLPRTRTVTFEACRDELPRGTVSSWTSSAPANWQMPSVSPPSMTDSDQATAALLDFSASITAPLSLRYSRLVSCRQMTDAEDDWQSRAIDVHALTGRIMLANGRTMSLGWSGFGDGLAGMAEGPKRARVEWVSRCAGTAAPVDAGDIPVVLAPQPAAVVAHEAIGHFSEAAASAAIDLRHRLGCRLAADDFDVFDDPTRGAAARYGVDDEGTVAVGPTQIVDGGVLVQQLHGRGSARTAQTLSTANARAAQITQQPIPRLSNLVVPAGTRSQDELVDCLGDGLLVHHLSHGFSRGLEIEARIVLAELVRSGRRTGIFVGDGRVTERIDVLARCIARGDRIELNPNALCGKHGQILYDVGTMAPAMLLSQLRIAR
ncbi:MULTISPECIES: metallopeptidase TldD-related protein [Bradyrhizobium]|uniref:metallopeptidase TldD-related protein n=1 Tax=Bradyrhizobium pachyrhizi TaxID=280333 RepID=UPI0004059988